MGGVADLIALAAEDLGVGSPSDACGMLRDNPEHRFGVTRGGDDAVQDVGQRGLLLDRLGALGRKRDIVGAQRVVLGLDLRDPRGVVRQPNSPTAPSRPCCATAPG